MAVTTRHGGVSAAPYDTLNLGLHVGDDPAQVVANRARAAAAFGATLEDLVFARQVHGARGDAGRAATNAAAARAPMTTPCPAPTSSSR